MTWGLNNVCGLILFFFAQLQHIPSFPWGLADKPSSAEILCNGGNTSKETQPQTFIPAMAGEDSVCCKMRC